MRSSWLIWRIALVCGVCLVGTFGVLVYYVGFVLKGIYPGQLLILLLLLGTLVGLIVKLTTSITVVGFDN